MLCISLALPELLVKWNYNALPEFRWKYLKLPAVWMLRREIRGLIFTFIICWSKATHLFPTTFSMIEHKSHHQCIAKQTLHCSIIKHTQILPSQFKESSYLIAKDVQKKATERWVVSSSQNAVPGDNNSKDTGQMILLFSKSFKAVVLILRLGYIPEWIIFLFEKMFHEPAITSVCK